MQMRPKSISPQKRSFSGPSILALGLLLSGFCFVQAMPKQEQAGYDLAETRNWYRTKHIEDIRVGDRVLADNPDVKSSPETQVDPATWRKLVLRAEERWDDGTLDVINVETLQSLEWIEAFDAQVGSTVPIPLDLVEMGLPDDLRAKVMAIDPCPSIMPGSGRVVLTTVSHLNRAVVELTVRDINGRVETIRPTAFHKFYRANDNAWVTAVALQKDDILHDVNGRLVSLASSRPLPGTYRVYNMTVDGEHVYYVSGLGILVHNSCYVVDVNPGVRMKRISGALNTDEAIQAGRSGQNISARSKKEAKRIAEAISDQGKAAYDRPRITGGGVRIPGHYHPLDAAGERMPPHIYHP